ncbi:chemotaxis response regulator protein-glutamate methylesterase [bacterium]|nr:chemotaxis response regulator protein-glutamate methylesterase [bacterium]
MIRLMKSGKIYTNEMAEIFKVRLGFGFFICGYDPVLNKSFCLWSAKMIPESNFVRLLLEEVPWVKTSNSLTVKIISSFDIALIFEKIFLKLQISNFKKIARQDVGDEVYFYSFDGRLRAEVAPEKKLNHKSVPQKKIKVLIIDDSETIHKLLTHIFNESNEIEVIGTVADPFKVEEAVIRLRPDVMTVDIHMDGMNGVQLLQKILPRFPIPSLLVTSLSINDGPYVLEGLKAGAVDHIQKPTIENIEIFADDIIEKIKIASVANIKLNAFKARKNQNVSRVLDQRGLIAIGASTGGTEALAQILSQLPSQIPPIFVVQHIPAQFSKAFADRLNHLCSFEVCEAIDGQIVKPNCVYIAPGGRHMVVESNHKGQLYVKVIDGETVNRHRPSVDVLFNSIAHLNLEFKGGIGILLTGMGTDGAQGLLNLKNVGFKTLAQDKDSSVVYGMPKAAYELNAVDQVVALEDISETLIDLLQVKSVA